MAFQSRNMPLLSSFTFKGLGCLQLSVFKIKHICRIGSEREHPGSEMRAFLFWVDNPKAPLRRPQRLSFAGNTGFSRRRPRQQRVGARRQTNRAFVLTWHFRSKHHEGERTRTCLDSFLRTFPVPHLLPTFSVGFRLHAGFCEYLGR